MRLIDADTLSESIKRGAGTDLQKFFADVCVAAAPTVDAVPVVRCEKCAFSQSDGWVCGGTALMPPHQTFPDSFCECGAKMDGGDSDAKSV